MSFEEHERLKKELREREISEEELGKHKSSVGDRSLFLIGITVSLLGGFAIGVLITLDYCGCSLASFF